MNSPSGNDPANGPVFELDTEATYTLELVARLTGVSSQTILYYREQGLIKPVAESPHIEPRFNDDALRKLRRIEHLRASRELTESGLRLVVHLLDEIEHLRAELRERH